MRKPTTTTFAILGLLAIRPWSTYELTQQVRKNLGKWWPKSERLLYDQPKILVEHGLATAVTETVGRRRTVYNITPAGREALREWLDEPSSVYAFEWDAILRVFFAEHGTKEQLLRTLRVTAERVHDDAWAEFDEIDKVLQPGYQFTDRAHLFALILKFEVDVYQAVANWFDWATHEVESWPDTNGPDHHLELFGQQLDAYRTALPRPRRH